MDFGGTSWAVINIIGPLLLVVVLGWAFLRNRKSRGNIDQSERATREAYDQEEATRRAEDEPR